VIDQRRFGLSLLWRLNRVGLAVLMFAAVAVLRADFVIDAWRVDVMADTYFNFIIDASDFIANTRRFSN